MKQNITLNFTLLMLGGVISQASDAAISLDRTRVIFDGNQNTMSVNIRNDNSKLPYLAQAWVEDKDGNKIQSPLMALPPLQRVEPGDKSLVKLQLAPGAAASLPQDKESLFYFNLREIPPKSTKPNVLQLALQTRVKIFYRPASLAKKWSPAETPWQEKLTLTRQGDRYEAHNPTPYYITLIADGTNHMDPVMISPQSSALLGVSAASMGSQPHMAYINDWGGRPVLTFRCAGDTCSVSSNGAR